MRNRIEELRKARGFTQQALGEALGVSRQTIISLESGRYNPSLILAHALAVLFQTSIEEIFMFDEEEKS
ncbi:helix-turn-helix transcriptional regulator [[Clostridium] aminophilum]|uniref:helix-turn-helix transcriptional regulator n=1 Tax=[Clostridium] aminophilum TaxID=1526 RepID=UPI00332D0CEB